MATTTTRVRLVKITLLAAFAPGDGLLPGAEEAGLASTADGLAEMLRDGGALTVASAYDDLMVDIHEVEGEDTLSDALLERFPEDPSPGLVTVPAGKQRRHGVEIGCGKADCEGCYEPAKGRKR